MSGRAVVAVAIAGLAASGLVACQSSQSKSAELAKTGHSVLKKETGLQISQQNTQVDVVDTAVLSDKNGAAVVVTLKNNSTQGLGNTPIAIDVQDAKGKSVFKNDAPGLEQSLTSVSELPAGQTVDWVNDQVLAVGKPQSVKVQLGQAPDTLPPELPEMQTTSPKIEVDPVSGTQATGKVTNNSDVEQRDLILNAVARKGDQVVAAGRGELKRLAPGKTADYTIFFIGDPKGAKVTVTAPATLFQ